MALQERLLAQMASARILQHRQEAEPVFKLNSFSLHIAEWAGGSVAG